MRAAVVEPARPGRASSGGSRAGLLVATSLVVWGWALPSVAQVLGEQAEMERLQAKAEEAIANEDAEGAAMNMGKAALMAARLAKQAGPPALQRGYQAAEALFRAEEHAYRAMALFQRAGGQPPASSGVCGSLHLAQQSLRRALELLEGPPGSSSDSAPASFLPRLRASAREWVKTLEGLGQDFQCG